MRSSRYKKTLGIDQVSKQTISLFRDGQIFSCTYQHVHRVYPRFRSELGNDQRLMEVKNFTETHTQKGRGFVRIHWQILSPE